MPIPHFDGNLLPGGEEREGQDSPSCGIPYSGSTAARRREGPAKTTVIIETPEQVYQAIEQTGRMQRILESYRNEVLGPSPRNFSMLAEAA